jgi:hypothetical protein
VGRGAVAVLEPAGAEAETGSEELEENEEVKSSGGGDRRWSDPDRTFRGGIAIPSVHRALLRRLRSLGRLNTFASGFRRDLDAALAFSGALMT